MKATIHAIAIGFALCGAVACDPVNDRAVSALGGDPSGEHTGPEHRPGQPCLLCHGPGGSKHPTLLVAGTIYAKQFEPEPLPGALVNLAGADGSIYQATTNRTGNFLVQEGQWSPVYPLHVSVEKDGVRIEMKTHIGREGSCAACHQDPAGPTSAGRVYLVAAPVDAQPEASP